MTFKEFHEKYNYLTAQESIEFYSIFQGHPFLKFIDFDGNLFEMIEKFILERIEDLKPYFIYDSNLDFQHDLESILYRLSIGDRKSYTVYKKENISQGRGRMLYKALFEKNVIKKEKTRERPKREFKGQLIKKHLRHYDIQDKIHFCSCFTRFWFTFIYPYTQTKKEILTNISSSLEQYISLDFEALSLELIEHKLGKDQVKSSGSYWDKKMEIDVLIETKNGTIIAGESKWKNHRISKKTLNYLIRKCERAYFNVDKFVLFSKSGFTKELTSLKSDTVSLYTLKDFEALYD